MVDCGDFDTCYQDLDHEYEYCNEAKGRCAYCRDLCSPAISSDCQNKCSIYLKRNISETPTVGAMESGAPSSFEKLLQRQMQLEYLAMATLGVLVLVVVAWLGLACYRHSRTRRKKHVDRDSNLRSVPLNHLYETVPMVPNNYMTYTPRSAHRSGASGRSGASSSSGSFSSDSREPGQDTDLTGDSNLHGLRLNLAPGQRTEAVNPRRVNGEFAGVIGRLSDDNNNSTRSGSPIIHQRNPNVELNSLVTHTSSDTGISSGDSMETTMLKRALDTKANGINEYKVSVP